MTNEDFWKFSNLKNANDKPSQVIKSVFRIYATVIAIIVVAGMVVEWLEVLK